MGKSKGKAAYLRGLAEGMKLDDKTEERKLIKLLIEAVTELAKEQEDIGDALNELIESVGDLEESIETAFDEDEEFDGLIDDDFVLEYRMCVCPSCKGKILVENDLPGEDPPTRYRCPLCKAEVQVLKLDDVVWKLADPIYEEGGDEDE